MDADDLAAVICREVDRAVAPLLARIAVLEQTKADAASVGDSRAVFHEAIGTVRERLAVLETRAPVPGPPGRDGAAGLDGFGFDDIVADIDGHTLTLGFKQGDRVRAFPLDVPWLVYRDVWADGSAYVPGDVVTWAGSAFVCRKATTAKPEDGADWKLAVKRGRDGRDRKI